MNKTLTLQTYLIFVLLYLPFHSVKAQIKINEILASNTTINIDSVNNAYADWIELYNAGDASVNLKGYSITDNFSLPEKYVFTTDINIASKGYVLIWCDDSGSGTHTNFKLSASGEEIGLYDPSLVLVDSVTFGPQNMDVSYARYPNGGDSWFLYLNPTPAASNDSTGFADQVLSLPDFKIKGGIYTNSLLVEAYNDMGGTIRYTLDGSEPTSYSTIYTGGIPILKTTCLRARIFKDYQIPGPVATETYFINEGFENRKLPVVSIATNPKNFWDASVGIYVQSFKPEWEIPVNVELFENNGSDRAGFNEKAGIKVNGLYSWKLPQKMLGVYFRKQYGVSKLDFPIFNDRPRQTFDNFALRASGNDWSNTLFRDGLVQQACHNYNMDLDNMAFRASIVYVNGEYFGIHNIREKVDEDYVASNHHLKEGDFDLVENGDFAENGDLIAWNSFWRKVNHDLTIQTNYDSVAAVFDLSNFIDLIAVEAYSGNSSIDHNTMAWKPKAGGKWRWILMDLDRGFNTQEPLSFLVNQTVWPFKQLMRNADFKKAFGTRLANLLYTTFNPIRMKQQIDAHQQSIEAEIPRHVARWLGTTSSYGDAMPSVAYWYNEVEKLRSYADARNTTLLNDLATNYGFSAPVTLSLSNYPSVGGEIKFNDLQIPESTWDGLYPKNLALTLKAVSKPGYIFKGWSTSTPLIKTLVAKKSSWKYLCDGTDQGTAWYSPTFNADSWPTGNGKFGYGDTQNTLLTYGSNSDSKYITYYFRTTFTATEADKKAGFLNLNILRDDGAVVYLNGNRIVRSNMPADTINYTTLATTSANNTEETTYYPYKIDPSFLVAGTNVLAVEVHQNTPSSSDLGFDLELNTETPDTATFVSTSDIYPLTLTANQSITAIYTSDGKSVVPANITENLTFYKALSPYYVQGDVKIAANKTLTIEPGVTVLMAPASKFMVTGSIQALGTATDSILFKLNPAYPDTCSWGALCFINTTDTTRMRYVTLQDATRGPNDYRLVSAISGWNTNLILDHITLTDIDDNPIAARYSSVTLTNSNIHSKVLGDGINVKYGKGRVENCTFQGNPNTDTDAVDYDGVIGGIIKNVRIHGFPGFNSDAIDIGEDAKNIQIDSVFIYDITDKGISVGQRSSVWVNNATIINTNLGLGVKDSSFVHVSNSTFFAVGTPMATYEKIAGRKGGNSIVTNSILSNSYDRSYENDSYSTTLIKNSLSDTDTLPGNGTNLFGDPGFTSPGFFDFGRKTASPMALGSNYHPIKPDIQVTLSEIFYNINKATDRAEFIGLINPGETTLDLSGFYLSDAVEYTFPEGTNLEPGKQIFVVNNNVSVPFWINATNAFIWTSGNLSNEGETVRISDASGIVQDQIRYQTTAPWPDVSGADEKVLKLLSPEMDNHFASSWTTVDYNSIVGDLESYSTIPFGMYPNPTRGSVFIQLQRSDPLQLDFFNLTGQKVLSKLVENGQTIDLSAFAGQILFARTRNKVVKVVVLK
jgi:hypothetical protein